MSNDMKSLFKLLVLAAFLLVGCPAFAQSVAGCGEGNQDSACVNKLSKAPEVQPTCPTGAGYTTVTPSTWIGFEYSQPVCNYQPPPTCGGETETVAPTWNGLAWEGLGCSPALPPGFTLAPDGMPYAMMLGYCGEVSQTTILHIVHYVESCTTSMAGASRVNQAGTIDNGNGTLDYWNTPSSFTTTSTSTYRNAPGPSGTVVQTVNIAFGDIQYDPDDCGCDATPMSEGQASGGTGSAEGWVFACPAAYPTINFSTVAAYGESNPTLIECGP
jgi:hypothetical protein